MELLARSSDEYELLDAGDGARLERFGPWILRRPSPVALWPREHPELWDNAHAVYRRFTEGTGKWEFRQRPPERWPLRWDGFQYHIRLTSFGHVGLFPEHTTHWDWVRQQVAAGSPCRVLHLFAYTGAMTLLAARAGAEVCHVDSVLDVNNWARENARDSGLADAPIRWITDDVKKFTAREIRRNRLYDGIILDPPSYGKGPQGEKWILEEHLQALLAQLLALAPASPRFVLFTCHSLGFSPVLMRNLLLPWQERFGGTLECGTMALASLNCRCHLPAGFFARWRVMGQKL